MRKTQLRHLVQNGMQVASLCLCAAHAVASVDNGAVKDPSVLLKVGEETIALRGSITPGDKEGLSTWTLTEPVLVGDEIDGFKITSMEAVFNMDPSIAYALGVADFGAPSSFAFFFSTPIVPTGPVTTVSGSIVGGLTDFTGNGVSITPTFAKVQSSFVNPGSVSMGVDVGPAFAAGATGVPGAFYPYLDAVGPIAGPVGIWTGLDVVVAFGLSGGGDLAALTGFAEIHTSVPDAGPGSVGLASLGMLVLASGYMRRTSRTA